MDWEYLDVGNEFDPGITPDAAQEESFHIVISDDEILSIDGVHPWRPLNQDEWRWLGLPAVVELYLGSIRGIPIYACEVDPDADEPEGYEFESLWSFLGQVDENDFYLIGRARQIIDWHRDHHYCGQCGQVTDVSDSDRSRVCATCNMIFYPRLSPSVIVLITRGDEVLLAKNAQSRGNFYSTLAGFMEAGESIEDTVHREVFEEVGLKIKNLEYFGSQSWPFPNSLMLGFHAEYSSGEIVLQEEEISDAKWFSIHELPNRPAMFSISGWLINDYLQRVSDNT